MKLFHPLQPKVNSSRVIKYEVLRITSNGGYEAEYVDIYLDEFDKLYNANLGSRTKG